MVPAITGELGKHTLSTRSVDRKQRPSKANTNSAEYCIFDRYLQNSEETVASPTVPPTGSHRMRKAIIKLFIRWMDYLKFYVLFKSISVIISGRLAGDNERLSALEPCLRL